MSDELSVSVWKFPLPDDGESTIVMPRHARILSVQVQQGRPCIWALVDVKQPENVRRRFWVLATGWIANAVGLGTFVGTIQIQDGSFVFHVFDGGESEPFTSTTKETP